MTSRRRPTGNPVYDLLPDEEIIRRVPGLVVHFGATSDKPLIACVNVDFTYLRPIDGVDPRSIVSVHHTQVKCPCCGDAMWIGPNQLTVNGTRICYVCLAILLVETGADPTPVMLDPNADRVPRRFT